MQQLDGWQSWAAARLPEERRVEFVGGEAVGSYVTKTWPGQTGQRSERETAGTWGHRTVGLAGRSSDGAEAQRRQQAAVPPVSPCRPQHCHCQHAELCRRRRVAALVPLVLRIAGRGGGNGRAVLPADGLLGGAAAAAGPAAVAPAGCGGAWGVSGSGAQQLAALS